MCLASENNLLNKRLKLDYEEITPCLKEVTLVWEKMLSVPGRSKTKFDMEKIHSAIGKGEHIALFTKYVHIVVKKSTTGALFYLTKLVDCISLAVPQRSMAATIHRVLQIALRDLEGPINIKGPISDQNLTEKTEMVSALGFIVSSDHSVLFKIRMASSHCKANKVWLSVVFGWR